MKKKIKWKNIILLFIIFILLITFCISLYNVIYKLKKKNDNDKLINSINSMVKIEEVLDNKKEDIVLDDTLNREIEDSINYYYEYLKVSFMDADYSSLKEINDEVVGWINVSGAGINYPYVQTTNNNFYLYNSFDKTKNDYGWIFLDYRNQNNLLDKNTIIYAHGGNSLAMFGPLKKLYDKKDWYNNPNNHYIKLSTEDYNYVFKVFSLYVVKTTSDYLKIEFNSDTSYEEFLDMLKSRSYYEFETNVNSNDKIITLSTCYNKKEKLVLHGKLIKEQTN